MTRLWLVNELQCPIEKVYGKVVVEYFHALANTAEMLVTGPRGKTCKLAPQSFLSLRLCFVPQGSFHAPILVSDWSRHATWPEYWPLIGQKADGKLLTTSRQRKLGRVDQEKRAPRTHASTDDAQYTCLARKLTITIGARGETRELRVASGKTYRVRWGVLCVYTCITRHS